MSNASRSIPGYLVVFSSLFALFLGLLWISWNTPTSYPKNPERGETLVPFRPSVPIKIGIFSDNHNNQAALREIYRKAEAEKYDLMICLGDIVSSAQGHYIDYWVQGFNRIQAGLAKPIRTVFVPGNHETDAGQKMELFGNRFGRIPTYFRAGKNLFFLLNDANSFLDDGQIAWVDQTITTEYLKEHPYHLFFFLHVPPIRPLEEGKRLEPWDMNHVIRGGVDRLREILKRYPVTALICGHIGASLDATLEGKPVLIRGGGGGYGEPPFNDKCFFLELTLNGPDVSWRNVDLETKPETFDFDYYIFVRFYRWYLPLTVLFFLLSLGSFLRWWRKRKAEPPPESSLP